MTHTSSTTTKIVRPRAGARRKTDADYAREMEEQAANAAAESARLAAGEAFMAELNTALDSFKTGELPAVLAQAMRENGPAVTLVMFDRLFPQFDLAVGLKSE